MAASNSRRLHLQQPPPMEAGPSNDVFFIEAAYSIHDGGLPAANEKSSLTCIGAIS